MILWFYFLKLFFWWLDFNIWILRGNKYLDNSGRLNGRIVLENSLEVV